MKKQHIPFVIVALLAILTFQPFPVQAGIVEAEKDRVNLTLFSYNAGDGPNSIPFMSLIFHEVPSKEIPKIKEWKKEIDEKLEKLGGVIEEEDYPKVAKIIPDYVARFISTGATAIAIEFPRKKQGILLFKKKDPPVPAK